MRSRCPCMSRTGKDTSGPLPEDAARSPRRPREPALVLTCKRIQRWPG